MISYTPRQVVGIDETRAPGGARPATRMAKERRGPRLTAAPLVRVLCARDPPAYCVVTEVESVMLVSDPWERGSTFPVTVSPSTWSKSRTGREMVWVEVLLVKMMFWRRLTSTVVLSPRIEPS